MLSRSALVAAVLVAPAVARADHRAFDFTYEYATQPAHGVELEVTNTQGHDGVGASPGEDRPSTWHHRAQVEYGVTDRLDLALAQDFEQRDREGARYAATLVRARYRFVDRGEWPVDVAVIVEAGKRFARRGYELEPRLVIARRFGTIHVAVNAIGRVELTGTPGGGATDLDAAFVPGWAAGVRAELSPVFSAGLESWGWARATGGARRVETWVGPALSARPSTKLWLTVGGGAGLTRHAVDAMFRFIVALSI